MNRLGSSVLRTAAAAVLLLALVPGAGRAQSIQTIAGGGADEGRFRTLASMTGYAGAFDANGNLLFADNNRVRRISAADGGVTTVAGNGSAGFTGDGGPATLAAVNAAFGIAVDPQGNVFVADLGNAAVRRISPSGIISTVAGTGAAGSQGGENVPATQAQLSFPSAIAVDGAGNLFIADAGNNRVRRVDLTTGLITTYAGTGAAGAPLENVPATQSPLRTPLGIALDGAGNLVVADRDNQRVRRIDRATGQIRTIAGTGATGAAGDGGPATQATLNGPSSLAADGSGNVYVSCRFSNSVRRITPGGSIDLVAGTGAAGYSGDGGPASLAALNEPSGLAVDSSGSLYVFDLRNFRIRRVDAGTRLIATFAGNGSPNSGDGGPAVAAGLSQPADVARDSAGNLFIANFSADTVKRIAAGSGRITTVAGTGVRGGEGDGLPATQAQLEIPGAVAVDGAGNLYIAETQGNRIRRVDVQTGLISRFAGTGTRGLSGDGGPATQAAINYPTDVVVDPAGNVYVADFGNTCVRRISAGGTITPYAGSCGVVGSTGDGGPATRALLAGPAGLALDASGGLLIADQENNKIRYVTPGGIIRTLAGTGVAGHTGDGGAATQATLSKPTGVAVDAAGNVLVAERGNHTIRRVTVDGRILAVAGTGSPGFSGDGGPAAEAALNTPLQIAVSPGGDAFVADQQNGRIRSILACVSVSPPALSLPSNGATGVSLPLTLSWSAVPGAFRYDLFVDTANPPARLLAGDLGATSFDASNLDPGVRYFWRVVAKGDPFCPSAASASSAVSSFVTGAACRAPAPFAGTAPSDGATGLTSPLISWQAAEGAGTYDLYLGPSSPPALFAAGLSSTSFAPQGLAPGSAYTWFVVSHAACDPTKTTSTATRAFTLGGLCSAPASFSLLSPPPGSGAVAANPTLAWAASSGAAAYDVYLGPSNPPALYLVDLTATTAPLSGLASGTTYYWQVVAKVPCDPTKKVASPVASFTVGGACIPPSAPAFTFTPPGSVGAGQTYVVSWSEPAGLDGAASYVVERSTNVSFSPLLDSQETTARFASFTAGAAGTYYHRVRAVRPCAQGTPSATATVEVVDGAPNVVLSVAPAAVLVALGEKVETKSSSFTLENIGVAPVSLRLTQQFLPNAGGDPVAFFVLRDPQGGGTDTFTLEPRRPKTFEVRFQGVDTSVPASLQGLVIVLQSNFQPLAIAPYGFVNLKVGATETVAPQFVDANGTPTESAFFPGFASGDDRGRDPISVGIRNPGSAPMELAAEIAPEVWLEPETGWNATPIAPGATRTVRLYTRRSQAPNGSALPRYTYFTVRTRGGASARLLVQDDDLTTTTSGRASALGPADRSFIVPSIASVTSRTGGRFVSRVRITNAASQAVQTTLVFTPPQTDGFGSGVRSATVLVPPGDAVALTDPVTQLFGLPSGSGDLEVRAAPERIGSLTVTSGVDAPGKNGGSFGFQMPTLLRGEGAKLGRPSFFSGLRRSAAYRSNLILVETTGADAATVQAALYDTAGAPRGSAAYQVPRYGQVQVNDVVGALGGADVDYGRIELTVTAGGGTVAGVATVIDNATDDASTLVAQPLTESPAGAVRARLPGRSSRGSAASPRQLAIPAVVSGYRTFPGTNLPYEFRSALTLTAGSATPATFSLRYLDSDPGTGAVRNTILRDVTVPARGTYHSDNVLVELFGIPSGQPSQGPLFVEVTGIGQVFCRVYSLLDSGSLGDGFPVVPLDAESLTGAGRSLPVYVDGLEQSTDSSRGTRSNLILTEVGGQPVTVDVKLYEAGNRSRPIGEGTYSLAAYEKKQLSTVFRDLGLDSTLRRKDRTNVLCVVTATSGNGLAAAVVTTIDNRTGDTRTALLSPSGGVAATGSGGAAIGF